MFQCDLYGTYNCGLCFRCCGAGWAKELEEALELDDDLEEYQDVGHDHTEEV